MNYSYINDDRIEDQAGQIWFVTGISHVPLKESPYQWHGKGYEAVCLGNESSYIVAVDRIHYRAEPRVYCDPVEIANINETEQVFVPYTKVQFSSIPFNRIVNIEF